VEKIGRYRIMIKLRKILLEEYTQRLVKAISEVDVLDSQGNIIIAKDLKVRHNEDGIQVVLRDPEEPRVEPQGEEGMIMDNTDPYLPEYFPELPDDAEEAIDDEGEVLYVIDKDEFEKDYELD
jgi:hypothetical protein